MILTTQARGHLSAQYSAVRLFHGESRTGRALEPERSIGGGSARLLPGFAYLMYC